MSEINLEANGNLSIGEFVGRDKIVTNIQNIVQRALTAAEEAAQDKAQETKALAEGVSAFVQRLQAVAQNIHEMETGSPYKGLLEYRLSDAQNFFGRSQAIREVLQHLAQGRLTVLHAESGAGKSSLVQAGLAPRLIGSGQLPLYVRPHTLEPSLAIKRAFLPDLSLTPLLATAPLREFLQQVTRVLGSQTRLYIFLDQFEEFFTQLEAPARAEFTRELAECVDDEGLNVQWMVALRAEFFGHLANLRPLIRNPFENEYRLNQLSRAEAREVIVAPAERHHLKFEDGLVDSLLNDLATGVDNVPPPQIQLVCSALYEALKPGETALTRALYNAQGGAAGILRGHLERVLQRRLTSERRQIAQRALEALVTADARRTLRTRAELQADLNAGAQRAVEAETLEAVLEQLVESNLLRSEEAPQEEQASVLETAPGLAYELAHDYLLEQITVDPAVQARKAAQELLEQEVRAYERYGTLLNADKLAVLKAQQENLAPTATARELLQRSERRLRQQQQIFAGSISVAIGAIIIALIFFGLALNAGQRQHAAVSTQQAAETEAAVAAVQRGEAQSAASTAQAQQATSVAQAAVAATRVFEAQRSEVLARDREAAAKAVVRDLFTAEGLVPVGQRPTAFVFDGQRLWVANLTDGTVQSIDIATGEADTPLHVGTEPRALAFDGARLWVANAKDNTVQSIDPATHHLSAPIAVGKEPSALTFDGARLWIANAGDASVQALDPASGQLGAPIAVGQSPTALAFDGTRVWVANTDDNTVQAIAPTTAEVSQPVSVGPAPTALIYDGTRLWVTNLLGSAVQTIDPITMLAGDFIAVNDTPYALAFDGRRIWVANRGSSTLQTIDSATNLAGPPIRVSGGPTALAFAGERLWIANQDSQTVRALDPMVGNLSAPIEVGQLPAAAFYDGANLWVANLESDTVQILEPATIRAALSSAVTLSDDVFASTTGSIDSDAADLPEADEAGAADLGDDSANDNADNTPPPTGAAPDTPAEEEPPPTEDPPPPSGMFNTTPPAASARPKQALIVRRRPADLTSVTAPSPTALAFDGERLWVASARNNTVQVINPMTSQIGRPIAVGQSPIALAIDGAHLWVANYGDDTVIAIDLETGTASAPVSVGRGPAALAYDGNRLWVANSDDNTVQAINLKTGVLGAPIAVGKQPVALAFDGTRLWVANAKDDTVQSLDPATGQTGQPIPTGNRPTALAFDGARLWVANYWSNTVRAIDPASAAASAPIAVDIGPFALHFDGTRLWIVNRDSDTVQDRKSVV